MSTTLSSGSLVSLEEAREALSFEAGEVTDNNFLISLINRVSKRCDTYAKRTFKASLHTEYHDSDGINSEVFLNNPPVTMVSGLWDDADRVFGSDTEIAAADFIIYEDEGIIKLFNSETTFSRGNQSIKVIYSGGYESIPDDIKDACLDWVAFEYRRWKEKSHGFTSKSTPGGGVSYDPGAIPAYVKSALDMYKLRRVSGS